MSCALLTIVSLWLVITSSISVIPAAIASNCSLLSSTKGLSWRVLSGVAVAGNFRFCLDIISSFNSDEFQFWISITSYSPKWIYKLAERYNQSGARGLGDRRHQNQGKKPLLDDVGLAYLWQRLQTPPPDGGLWNSRKVAEWMSEFLEHQVRSNRKKNPTNSRTLSNK